jgi:sortase (surface protein transpeptidase)
MRRRKVVIKTLVICFFMPCLLAGLSACRVQREAPPAEPPAMEVSEAPLPEPEPVPEPAAEPEPEPEPEPLTAWPVRVIIPALAADVEIQDTGYDASNTMEIVAAADIISWLRESAIPGNAGNAILGGHNKWRGTICPLFALDTLQIGDEMEIVYADGLSLKFRLESVFVYALATAPAYLIMDVGGEARVTLITCKEPFNKKTGTSDNRIVAVFKEESVFAVPDPPIEPFPPLQKK